MACWGKGGGGGSRPRLCGGIAGCTPYLQGRWIAKATKIFRGRIWKVVGAWSSWVEKLHWARTEDKSEYSASHRFGRTSHLRSQRISASNVGPYVRCTNARESAASTRPLASLPEHTYMQCRSTLYLLQVSKTPTSANFSGLYFWYTCKTHQLSPLTLPLVNTVLKDEPSGTTEMLALRICWPYHSSWCKESLHYATLLSSHQNFIA